MDKKDFMEEDDAELRATMGQYFNQAQRLPGDGLQPGKASMPKPPEQVTTKATGKGTPPPFPVIPMSELGSYEVVKQTDKDTFGLERSGQFDPELNELALKEVAESRGITVEELLKSQADRKSEVKLERAGEAVTPEPQDDIQALEAKLAAAKAKLAESQIKATQEQDDITERIQARERQRQQAADLKARESSKIGIPKEMNDNPVIQKLRRKLGLEAEKSVKVTIEDIKFEMQMPTASLNLWVLEKIQAAAELSGIGAPVDLSVKIATVSASIKKIEDTPVNEVLGLKLDEYDQYMGQIIVAQTLWEMFLGLPSDKTLFAFHPELAVQLYSAFSNGFKNFNLESSLDNELHRYVCPMEKCPEMYDMLEPASGIVPFCKVHGIPTDDKGLVKELRSLPLA